MVLYLPPQYMLTRTIMVSVTRSFCMSIRLKMASGSESLPLRGVNENRYHCCKTDRVLSREEQEDIEEMVN